MRLSAAAVGLSVALVTVGSPALARATFPGRNGQLASEQTTADGHSALLRVYPNGDEPASIRRPDTWLAYPAYSPGGMRLVYTSLTAGAGSGVWVSRWNGGDRHLIRAGSYQTPSWSATGRSIISGFPCECQPRLYLFSSDGAGRVRVLSPFPPGTTSGVGAIGPVWSPAGGVIAFIAQVGTREEEVYSMRTNGTDLRRLTYTPAPGDYTLDKSRLDWSPDGRMLTFSEQVRRPDGTVSANVIVMDADGSGQHVVATGIDPLFSPNGNEVLYTSDDGSLRHVHPDGTDDAPYPFTMPYQFDAAPQAWQPLPGDLAPHLTVRVEYTRKPAEITVAADLGPNRGRELVTASVFHRVDGRWNLVGADERLTGRLGRYRKGLSPQLPGTCLLRFHYLGDPRYLPAHRTISFPCHRRA
jgi:WD40-like Beta Propeller Repeat